MLTHTAMTKSIPQLEEELHNLKQELYRERKDNRRLLGCLKLIASIPSESQWGCYYNLRQAVRLAFKGAFGRFGDNEQLENAAKITIGQVVGNEAQRQLARFQRRPKLKMSQLTIPHHEHRKSKASSNPLSHEHQQTKA